MTEQKTEQKTEPATRLSPQHQTAAQLIQQGLYHHRQGQIALAMERYTEVLRNDPQNADALYYVAVVACQEGQFKQGADLARRALSLGAKEARVHNLLGQALDRLGEPLEAIKSFDAALAADPNFAEAHGNRANILADAGMPEEALKSFERALAINPNSPTDLLNRGALLQDMGRHAEALASYDKALAIVPKAPAVIMNRANALAMLGRFAEAEAVYDAAIKLDPKSALAYTHKGLALKHQGRFDEARAALEQALTLEPKDAAASYALGQLLLLLGDWRAGFPHYERRLIVQKPAFEPLDLPQWQGEPAKDFRLVLKTEHGFADNVLMARYAPLLAGRGYPVWLMTSDELAPLMKTLPGVERVITSADELKSDPRRALWTPLLSLPRLLHLTPVSVPAQEPYLSADPARVAQWAERLGTQGFKVGIAWRGENTGSAAPLEALEALSGIEGVRLIALQDQPGVQDVARVPFRARIETPLAETAAGSGRLLDLAAVIANLDLVVSVDALTAHLAGALGKPVLLALPFVADWRWLTARDDTPWYATMRLFRQADDRQWEPVFARIAEAARHRAG